ncbi:hypothetical protein RGQ21_42660 [Kitasatospora aureofaciens]|nr:hypothetical protein RGQ21_42660 [Kitasatospora aureofaciens]
MAIQGNTETASSEWRFRRSGHISGLDNSDTNVLRRAGGRKYSQVGAALQAGRNTHVTHIRSLRHPPEDPDMSGSMRATSATPFGGRDGVPDDSGIDHQPTRRALR